MRPQDLYPLVIEYLIMRNIVMDADEPLDASGQQRRLSLFKETVDRSLTLRRDTKDVLRQCSCEGSHSCRRDVMVDELNEDRLPKLSIPLTQSFVEKHVSLIYIILL
jgi:hypothetical protein